MRALACVGAMLMGAGAVQAGVLVDDCEDVAAWSMPGQVIRPCNDAKVGAGALRFLVPAGAAPAWMGRALPGTDASQADVLAFWAKTDGPLGALQVRLQDDQETLAETAVSALQPRLSRGTWRFVVWPYRLRPGWVHGRNTAMSWSRLVGFHFLGGPAADAKNPVAVTVDEARLLTWAELRQELLADPEKRPGNMGALWTGLPQPDPEMMPRFLRRAAEEKLARLPAPRTPADVKRMQGQVRDGLRRAYRLDDCPHGPLRARVHEVIPEPDHVAEVISFQSWPGIYVTGVLYRPKARGRYPAVLSLMGHGTGATQLGSIGVPMARHGYVFLSIDVFGGGERGEVLPGSVYHGGGPGASLWLAGLPLSGLQVHDNRRALDYLCSRPDVDPRRLGVTGASGGGTATLHLAAYDTRVRCAVPSSAAPITSAEGYTRHHCMCDTIPAHFDFADENRLMAAVAPRALLVLYPSQDTPGQTDESLARAHRFAADAYERLGAADALRLRRIEGPHGYGDKGLDDLLGWFDRWLKGKGDGAPAAMGPPGPGQQPLETVRYRCFPNDARPPDFLTPSAFVYRRCLERAAKLPGPPASAAAWQEVRPGIAAGLERALCGASVRPGAGRTADPTQRHEGTKTPKASSFETSGLGAFVSAASSVTGAEPESAGPAGSDGGWRVERLVVTPEAGVRVPVALFVPAGAAAPVPCLLALAPEGKGEALDGPWLALAAERGLALAVADLRGMGETGDGIGESYLQARFHDFCEASIELGRPLLGQWLADVRAVLQALRARPDLDARRLYCAGTQEAGLAALFAAGLDAQVAGAAVFGIPASYLSPTGFGRPYMYKEDLPLGGLHSLVPFVPDILAAGDIPHLAALMAPRPLVIADAVRGDGTAVHPRWMQDGLHFARQTYQALGALDRLALLGPGAEAAALDHLLKRR